MEFQINAEWVTGDGGPGAPTGPPPHRLCPFLWFMSIRGSRKQPCLMFPLINWVLPDTGLAGGEDMGTDPGIPVSLPATQAP
jgi:hypothetical protein